MVIVQGLLLVAVAFMVIDSALALSNYFSTGSAPSSARKEVKLGLSWGDKDEEDEAESFWNEEMQAADDFSDIKDDLDDIEAVEDDLQSVYESLEQYATALASLRTQVSQNIESTDFDVLTQRVQFVKYVSNVVEELKELNHRHGGLKHTHTYYKRLLEVLKDRLDDVEKAAKDLTEQFQQEIEDLEAGLEDIKADERSLSDDDIEEEERETNTEKRIEEVLEANEDELSLLEETKEDIEALDDKIVELEDLNDQIWEFEKQQRDTIRDVEEELDGFLSAYTDAKEGDLDDTDAFANKVDDILAAFYDEDKALHEHLNEYFSETTPPLLERWDDLLEHFKKLKQEHTEAFDTLHEVERDVYEEREIHRTS
jgi:chromosome segregation ATPase